MMRVATPSRDYKKDAAMIVAVMKIECIVKTMIVIILQQPRIVRFHKVSIQDQ